HPARLREVLLELGVGAPALPPLLVEDDAGAPGGPLVDGQDHRAGRYPARLRTARRMSRSWRARWRKPAGVPPGARCVRGSSTSSRRYPARIASIVIPVSRPQPDANGISSRSVEIRIARCPESGA